jgi:hypothetical protein
MRVCVRTHMHVRVFARLCGVRVCVCPTYTVAVGLPTPPPLAAARSRCSRGDSPARGEKIHMLCSWFRDLAVKSIDFWDLAV